jgi:hypothetical protein
LRRGLGIFLFTALGPTQPPIQWVPGALSLGFKLPGREGDNSPPSSAKVKNAWSYNFTPQYVFVAWCLVRHKDNFTFTFTFNTKCKFNLLIEHQILSYPSRIQMPCKAMRLATIRRGCLRIYTPRSYHLKKTLTKCKRNGKDVLEYVTKIGA